MMTCKQITETATEWMEGALPTRQRVAFQLHLWMCRHCRRFVDQMKTTSAALRNLPPEPVPAPLHDELMARFRSLPGTASATRDRGSQPHLERLLGKGRGTWLFGGILLAILGFALFQSWPGASLGPHTCLAVILAAGVAPLVLIAGTAVISRTRYSSGVFLGPAGLGVLGGHFAAFSTGCATAETLPHMLGFHVGAAMLVGLIALSAARWIPVRA